MDKLHNPHVKKIAGGIQGARKSINSNIGDASDNVNNLKGNFLELQTVIKGQSGTIDSLQSFHKSMVSTNNRNLQAKNYLSKVYERFKSQIKTYIEIFKDHFISSNKKGQNWQKLSYQLQKSLSKLKDQADSLQKTFSAIQKIGAARQQIFGQCMKAMLYKKHLLWKDLNVPYQNYVHGQIKAIINSIKISQQKYGYIPSSIQFKTPKFQTKMQQLTSLTLINILMNDFNEMIEAVQNYSNLSSQMKEMQGISKNQKVTISLRSQIQTLTQNYQNLMDKYRNLQISKGRGNAASQASLADKLQEVQNINMKKQQEILDLKQSNIKGQTQIQNLKDKIKQLQDQISKWHNHQLPKIKDLQQSQKSLFDEFTKVRKDLQTFNSLLQAQKQIKTKVIQELKDQQKKVNGLVYLLGKSKRQIKQLKDQINRQQKINLQLADYLPDEIVKKSKKQQ